MNKEIILKQMKELNGENYSIIIEVLSEQNQKDTQVIKKVIDELLDEGVLCNTSKKKIAISESVGLKKGLIQITRNGAGFLLVPNGEDIFIPRDLLNGACAGDTVWVQQEYEKGQYLTRGRVKSIVKRSMTKVVGTVDILKSVAFVRPDNRVFTKDIVVPLNKLNHAKNKDKVFVEITSWGDREITGQVVEVLGKADNVDTDVLCICRNYDLREEFPEYVLEVARNCPQELKEKDYKDRVDLREEFIFTIDGIDTRDIDDAIQLYKKENGNYVLGVHIADVGHYVPQNSILNREAFLRGTSVYFPNNVFPMLPKELSNGICSLNEGVDRLTLSCVMEIDSTGEVVDSQVFEGVIKSKHKMNYDDCNAIIKGDKVLQEKYPDVTPVLLQMVELMEILEKRRDRLGAIVFDVPELKIILNDKKEIETFKAKPHDVAERLIESFMICANETISRTFERKKVPFVYRIHEKPDSLKVDSFKEFIAGFGVNFVCDSQNLSSKKIQEFLTFLKDKPYNQVANKVLLRSMSKAKYSPEPLGHYALALKDYTHFTSPIRRYCDLTIHRIIKKSLRNQVEGAYKNQLKMFVVDASARASSTEVIADKCERDVDDYFKARYMRDKIGNEYEGIINGTIDTGIFVELENTVEGFVSVNDLPGFNYTHDENRHLLTNGHNTYQMGDKITIKVDSVDMNRRKINFVLKDYQSDDFDLSSIDFGEGHTYKKQNTSSKKRPQSQYENPFVYSKKSKNSNGKSNYHKNKSHHKNKSRKNNW